MDKFNIINITNNIKELNEDFEKWINLPYDERKASDNKCMDIYKLTNSGLYNTLKFGIVNKTIPDDPELIKNVIFEGVLIKSSDNIIPELNFLNDEDQAFVWKKQKSEELNESPLIAIIVPSCTKNKLLTTYQKYLLLSDDNKKFSDGYSIQLWGFTVPNMYNIIKSKFVKTNDNIKLDKNNLISEIEESVIPIIDNYNKLYVENNLLGLMIKKLDLCCENMETVYSSLCESAIDNNIKNLNNISYSCLNSTVPYFNINERSTISSVDKNNYYKALNELMNEYNYCPNEELKSKYEKNILDLGWNPSVELNARNIDFAKERQIQWIKNNHPDVFDLSNILKTDSNNPDYSKFSSIFIILKYDNYKLDNIINYNEFSKVGIAINFGLDNIISFDMRSSNIGNFEFSSLSEFAKKDDKIVVMSLFIDKGSMNKFEDTIKNLAINKDKYNFENDFYYIFNNKNLSNDLGIICLQIINYILKLLNIDNEDTSYELAERPKLFILFTGNAKKYNSSRIKNIIVNIFNNYDIQNDVLYKDLMKKISRSVELEYFYCVTENAKANNILEQIRNIIKPVISITERKLPIKISDNGDLSINYSKSLEQEYQESHKLLINYTKNNLNIDGIKYELSRLFFINNTIEKKIKKMKKSDKLYKSLIDLRARVLNDFKKYLDIVLQNDSKFNFDKYYKSSSFYDSGITIDQSTLKFSGNLIKKFLNKK